MPYPYEVMDLPENAAQSEIRSQYLSKIQTYPPEQHPEKFQEITEANKTIKNEVRRTKLKLFGLPKQQHQLILKNLLPAPTIQRIKVGRESWLDAIIDNK